MRRLAAVTLLIMFVLNPLALYAEEKGFLDGFLESVGKITALMSVNQIMLYGVVAVYHSKFNKWPASKEEIVTALSDGSIDPKKESKEDPKDLVSSMDVTFKDLGDGTLLIEARYSDEMEKKMQEIGLGKFRISAIASHGKDGYIFTPSEKTKNNRDYFTLPGRMKPK